MSEQSAVRRVRPDERTEGQATPGMHLEQALDDGTMWAGYVTTDPGATSGWHHHGGHESSIYVVTGALRMEFGPGVNDVLDADAGDVLYVPPGAIHREGNPTAETSALVVVRAGTGPAVINVDGPAPG